MNFVLYNLASLLISVEALSSVLWDQSNSVHFFQCVIKLHILNYILLNMHITLNVYIMFIGNQQRNQQKLDAKDTRKGQRTQFYRLLNYAITRPKINLNIGRENW